MATNRFVPKDRPDSAEFELAVAGMICRSGRFLATGLIIAVFLIDGLRAATIADHYLTQLDSMALGVFNDADFGIVQGENGTGSNQIGRDVRPVSQATFAFTAELGDEVRQPTQEDPALFDVRPLVMSPENFAIMSLSGRGSEIDAGNDNTPDTGSYLIIISTIWGATLLSSILGFMWYYYRRLPRQAPDWRLRSSHHHRPR